MTVDIALVHYPVSNRKQEIVGSAVTNLDLHDIARVGRTYGVGTFYVVTPYEDQQALVAEILSHWLTGHGSRHNSDRKEAFSIIQVVANIEELYDAVRLGDGSLPLTLATSARTHPQTLGFDAVRLRLAAGEKILLLFGTASGLAPEVMAQVDAVLPPVGGSGEYNHLPVRAAVAIILDRLARNNAL